MATLNANIPYTLAFVLSDYTGYSENLEGYIFGVKSMINRPLHFHFQSNIGAIFWNIPISGFCHLKKFEILSKNQNKRLSLLESWDCQSNNISITTFVFLQNRKVEVFCRDKKWRSGVYQFTIDDYEGDLNELNIGYANDQDSKCFHFIKLDNGNFCIQPNNLLRWHNADFIIPYNKEKPPKFKITKSRLSSENNLDRTYGNSPYYFYEKYQK